LTGEEFTRQAQRALDAFVERVAQELAEVAARLVDLTFRAPAASRVTTKPAPRRFRRRAGRPSSAAVEPPPAPPVPVAQAVADDEPCWRCGGRCDVAAPPVAPVTPVISSSWVPAPAGAWLEVRS
jgi:hypothetical protein